MAVTSGVVDFGDGGIGFDVDTPARTDARGEQLIETLAVVERNPSKKERRRIATAPFQFLTVG